jgi:hypothetical protein
MVSGTLLVVGLAAELSTYGTLSVLLNHASRRSTAGVLAEATLEEMILRYPADPEISLGDHTARARHFDADGRRLNDATGATFAVTWTVKPYAKVATIREVTAHIAWTDLSGPAVLEVSTWRN